MDKTRAEVDALEKRLAEARPTWSDKIGLMTYADCLRRIAKDAVALARRLSQPPAAPAPSGPGRPMTLRECMDAEDSQPPPAPAPAQGVPVAWVMTTKGRHALHLTKAAAEEHAACYHADGYEALIAPLYAGPQPPPAGEPSRSMDYGNWMEEPSPAVGQEPTSEEVEGLRRRLSRWESTDWQGDTLQAAAQAHALAYDAITLLRRSAHPAPAAVAPAGEPEPVEHYDWCQIDPCNCYATPEGRARQATMLEAAIREAWKARAALSQRQPPADAPDQKEKT